MMTTQAVTRIAVIGFGPRGLGALEALADRCSGERLAFQVDVFDPSPCPGAGPNFDPAEPAFCLLNIPHRDIAIRPPEWSNAGPFAEWQGGGINPDTFPTRADLGRYLEARRADLFDRGFEGSDSSVQLISASAAEISRRAEGWQVQAGGQDHGPYAEVLLTLGQPFVHPDDQLAEWQSHAAATEADLVPAYPARHFAEAATQWNGKSVAIRGLGLSTFDVLRGLTVAQGGVFEGARYRPSGGEPARILPFSLNGQPPYPKPETEFLNAMFTPTSAETADFSEKAASAAEADAQTAEQLISAALTPPVARILAAHGITQSAIADWLGQEWSEPGTQDAAPPLETLTYGIDMARGHLAPSIGYAMGQVWRKWQDDWRAAFNPRQTRPETAKRLIGFDEGLKRYSYGPPLSSARELLALVEAGLVDLDCASDPKITTIPGGWALTAGTAEAEVAVMIDAVLPQPDLGALSEPPLPALIAAGDLTPVASGLAAATAPDGSLYNEEGDLVCGLCLLGRLALGSVTAVDSLHDCFGRSADRWVEGVLSRAAE
jgi:uncharacterized NAD(P)/FAD-binding protein YdhS